MIDREAVQRNLKDKELSSLLWSGLGSIVAKIHFGRELGNSEGLEDQRRSRLLRGRANVSETLGLIGREFRDRIVAVPGRTLRSLIRGEIV